MVEQLNFCWWNSRTSYGGTVEHLMIKHWNRDGGTAQHNWRNSRSSDGGTVKQI